MTGPRKSLDEQIKDGEKEVFQKQAYVAGLKAKKKVLSREEDKRRKIITGAVVETYASKDPGFGALLRRIRLEGVTRDCDREVFPELFPDVATKSAAAQRPMTAPESTQPGPLPP